MGYIFKDSQGNVIGKLLQFVATDAQVNAAITSYLNENGITLAEGVDLKKLDNRVTQNEGEISGMKSFVTELQQAKNVVLMEYKDHFFDEFEIGGLDHTNGNITSDMLYVRSKKLNMINDSDAVLLCSMPTGYLCSFYFYDADMNFQGATEYIYPGEFYKLSAAQIGWYVRALVYADNDVDVDKINIILAGSAVFDIIEDLKNVTEDVTALGESDLSVADQLEMNITKASLKLMVHSNDVLIGFFTDLHIACMSGKTAEELADSATKIKKQLATCNLISKEFPMDMCVYGGDYLDNSSLTDKATAIEALKAVRLLMDKTAATVPTIATKGNHDDNTMYTDYVNGYVANLLVYFG